MRIRLAITALLLSPLLVPVAAADEPSPQVVVSAHRGGAAYAPENTMAAFRNAARLGVDELEADVQLTADGELVLLHDDTLDRTTDCTGAVVDLAWAEISRCDAAYWWTPGPSTTTPDETAPHPLRGRRIGIPRLVELLRLAAEPGAPTLSLEIKNIPGEANFDPVGSTVATALVEALSDVDPDRVLIQSFFPTSLEAVQRLAPHLRTQFLTTSSTGQTAAQNLTYVTARQHEVVAPDHTAPDLTPELVEAAHAAGKQVVPWTLDTTSALQRGLALGVDGLITNRPACLLQLLGRPVPPRIALDRSVTPCEGE